MHNPVVVANYRTRLEAEVASTLLSAAGIPFLIQSGEGMLYGPLPAGSSILVRQEDVEKAKQLLSGDGPPAGPS